MIHVANYFPLLGTFFFRFWNAVFSVLSAQHHSFFVSLCCLFGWACESCSCQCHLQKLYFQSMHLPHLKKVRISHYIFDISLTHTMGTSVFPLRPRIVFSASLNGTTMYPVSCSRHRPRNSILLFSFQPSLKSS